MKLFYFNKISYIMPIISSYQTFNQWKVSLSNDFNTLSLPFPEFVYGDMLFASWLPVSGICHAFRTPFKDIQISESSFSKAIKCYM